MAASKSIWGALLASTAIFGLAACGGQSTNGHVATSGSSPDCVKIADGSYFVWDETHFVPTTKPEAEIEVIEAQLGWPDKIEKSFPGMGFSWMGLNVRENIATLTGLAPDKPTKERAFEAGKAAVLNHPEGKNAITLVVDGISVEGGESGVGDALVELGNTGLSTADCQKAFTDTMQGQNVEFATGSARISNASARLLDAVTGVATLCKAHPIEVEGHTDSVGGAKINQTLSQRRASAVKSYLVRKGVEEGGIEAIGYGESRPLNDVGDNVANAGNRRTQFTIK